MDISRPSEIPAFIEHLRLFADPYQIQLAITTYREQITVPDHQLYPLEYIEALDYLEVIDKFENLLNYELNEDSNPNSEGKADNTLQEGENQRRNLPGRAGEIEGQGRE